MKIKILQINYDESLNEPDMLSREKEWIWHNKSN